MILGLLVIWAILARTEEAEEDDVGSPPVVDPIIDALMDVVIVDEEGVDAPPARVRFIIAARRA